MDALRVISALVLGVSIMLCGRWLVMRRVTPDSLAILYATLLSGFVGIAFMGGVTVGYGDDDIEYFFVAAVIYLIMFVVLARDGRRVGKLRGTWPEKQIKPPKT